MPAQPRQQPPHIQQADSDTARRGSKIGSGEMEENRAASPLDTGSLIVIKDKENIVYTIFQMQLFVTLPKWQADPAVVLSANWRITPAILHFD